jgi:HK97 family phage major capsid protein
MASPAFNPQELLGRTLVRDLRLTKQNSVINREKRTVRVDISSDAPILHVLGGRTVAYVILDHKAESINLERINARSSRVLDNHDVKIRYGFQSDPVTDGHVLGVTWRFSPLKHALDAFEEIADALDHGDSPGVSAGFTIEKVAPKPERMIDNIPVLRATSWTPIEGSLATIEADLATGIGRCLNEAERVAPKPAEGSPEEEAGESADEEAAEGDGDPIDPTKTRTTRSETMTAAEIEAKRIADEAARAAANPLVVLETRTNDYVKFAVLYGNDEIQKRTLTEMAREFALTDKSEAELKAEILKTRSEWSTKVAGAMPRLTESEKQRYSIARAITADAASRRGGEDLGENGKKVDTRCFELEVSQQIQRDLKLVQHRDGFFMPTGVALRGQQSVSEAGQEIFFRQLMEMFKRAGLDTATPTAGQELVFTEAGSFIDMLRNKALVMQLGATVLPGLVGNVAFPRQTGAGAGHWVEENPSTDVDDDDAALDQVTLSPKTYQSSTSYSRQLLRQGTVNVDNIVQNDLTQVNALEIDRASLHGTGANNQPKGIYALDGVNTTSFASSGTTPGVISFAGVIDMETKIAVANADLGSMAYLTTPEVRGTAKQTAELSNTIALALWRGGEMNGFRAEASNQLSKTLGAGADHGIVFGVWSNLMIGEWGAIEVITDPYRLKKRGMIEVTTFLMADIQARYAQAFTKGQYLKKS